jgi:subtilisin family serine protease
VMSQFSIWADDSMATWGLNASRVVLETGGRFLPSTGLVALVDTGIDAAHPDLSASIDSAVSFVAGESCGDVIGHGTHCAGLIAGVSQGQAYSVAPETRLIVAKVVAENGDVALASVAEAVRYVTTFRPDAIVLPFGGPTEESDVLTEAILDAMSRGIAAIAPAGNGANEPVMYPARIPGVIAVGAADRFGRVAEFSMHSSSGAPVSVFAPGIAVRSTRKGRGYEVRDGSSMAAAFVAGLCVLWARASGLSGYESAKKLVEAARPLRPIAAGPVPAGFAVAPSPTTSPVSAPAA